jgi:CheY-like chemotaxis protein
MLDRAGRVVVIDDEEDWRDVVVQFLGDQGFDAVGFSDARAALAALRCGEAIPAVILLDLEMPGMTGWEFRDEQLRDPRLAGIPVVVGSASDPRAIDADALLAKPYDSTELCRVIADLSLRKMVA